MMLLGGALYMIIHVPSIKKKESSVVAFNMITLHYLAALGVM
jgi:hypothetical protein